MLFATLFLLLLLLLFQLLLLVQSLLLFLFPLPGIFFSLSLSVLAVLPIHTSPTVTLTRTLIRPLRLRTEQVGAGYSTLTEPVMNALTLAARTEGLILDPVYTGRALAGLVEAVRDGDVRPGERTVFLHSGGLPGLFGSGAAMTWAGSLGDGGES